MTINGAIYPSLKNKVVLVTGGASGIGASIVEHLAAQGAKVSFLDIDADAGRKLSQALAGAGCETLFLPCDLTDIEALRSAIREVRSALGPITGLVNNAARDDRHEIQSVTPEYWDQAIAVNLRHQFFAAQAVADDMRANKGGSIVNLGSVSWMIKNNSIPIYLTAKAAVLGLTRALARDLGPDNIRVNEVVPGWIMTERQIKLWLTPEGEAQLMKEQALKETLKPEDVARMVLWLLADDSRLVSAQRFVVDGGQT
jgi:NAD(P)-dependent dehydrogenase (short-subunit alcohol dehydrogenase family)